MKFNRIHLNERPSRRLNEYYSRSAKPLDKDELIEIIADVIKKEGNRCDLNFINTSLIYDMSYLFSDFEDFNGDISQWDMSNVENVSGMFERSEFNGDISEWNVSNVKDMSGMFCDTVFNQDISDWDVSNVENMSNMFSMSRFNKDISKWDVSNVENMSNMFSMSAFNKDISKWDVSNVKDTEDMFDDSRIKEEYEPHFSTNESRYSRSLTESRNRMPSNLRRFI